MLQIRVIFGPGVFALLTESNADSLGEGLTAIVRKTLCHPKSLAIPFTSLRAFTTRNAPDVQIEIYWVEGCLGINRLDEKQQGWLIGLIEKELKAFSKAHGLPDYSSSVLCQPYRGGSFKISKKSSTDIE